VRRNYAGDIMGTYDRGSWYLSSEGAVDSKDINDHFHYVLERLLPGRDYFAQVPNGETYFDVLWKSSYLYAGTGPLIDAASIAGIAALGAGVGFDIYQVDEDGA
jgi:hypothetical protein